MARYFEQPNSIINLAYPDGFGSDPASGFGTPRNCFWVPRNIVYTDSL
jgi:hypothetical protein